MPLTTSAVARGGAWLIETSAAESVFTPEKLTNEHKLIGQTADEFVENEVLTQIERLESKDWEFSRQLVRRCAALGLFGVDVPEEYGGLHLDKVSSLIVSERLSRSASFGGTFGAHANLCVLPLVLFGTEDQKRRYLPKLLTGEMIGAYALSESGSGSDALGARARAMRQEDGSFVLSGEKMWITNGGFADLYIVFAKVDGELFTAFLVERAFPGVSSGKEEHKMGLHGSSTTPLILQDVRVPAANLFGEVGKGHKVAFNVLNWGRFKLGAMCVGGCRGAIAESARYAAQRKQFGQPIAAFGAIKHKIGEMTARAYAIESSMYRTAGLIDAHLIAHPPASPTDGSAALAAVEEYAVEASIAKVAGSETLGFVLDENIQIHGGNGYVKDYAAERHYRDARVNRIFEGTNEINRLLIPGMLIKRALKGDLGLIAAARRLQDELIAPAASGSVPLSGELHEEARIVESLKKVALMILGTALQKYGEKLSDEQEVLMSAADVIIDTYLAESALLRATGASAQRIAGAPLHVDAARAYVNDAAMRVEAAARQALAGMAEGDTLRTLLAALRRLLKVTPVNTIAIRRRLADATVNKKGYLFA